MLVSRGAINGSEIDYFSVDDGRFVVDLEMSALLAINAELEFTWFFSRWEPTRRLPVVDGSRAMWLAQDHRRIVVPAEMSVRVRQKEAAL